MLICLTLCVSVSCLLSQISWRKIRRQLFSFCLYSALRIVLAVNIYFLLYLVITTTPKITTTTVQTTTQKMTTPEATTTLEPTTTVEPTTTLLTTTTPGTWLQWNVEMLLSGTYFFPCCPTHNFSTSKTQQRNRYILTINYCKLKKNIVQQHAYWFTQGRLFPFRWLFFFLFPNLLVTDVDFQQQTLICIIAVWIR